MKGGSCHPEHEAKEVSLAKKGIAGKKNPKKALQSIKSMHSGRY